MASTKYSFELVDFTGLTEATPNLDALTEEIGASAILTALDYMNMPGASAYIDIWFKAALSTSAPDDVAVLNAAIAAHTGVPIVAVQDVNIQSADSSAELGTRDAAFADRTGYNIYVPGHRFVCTKDTINNCDVSYSVDFKLQGMGFRVDDKPVDGDKISIQIVDVDGIVYPAGTVLLTFAEDMFVWPNREYELICTDVKTAYSWMYLRLVYDSTGVTDDVVLYWEHFLRSIPT